MVQAAVRQCWELFTSGPSLAAGPGPGPANLEMSHQVTEVAQLEVTSYLAQLEVTSYHNLKLAEFKFELENRRFCRGRGRGGSRRGPWAVTVLCQPARRSRDLADTDIEPNWSPSPPARPVTDRDHN
jgi:hypothetical protein